MTIARIATFPAGTKEQYEYLGQLMGDGVANQPERRLLASGPTDDGWTIIQIWESREALEQFIAEHLRPAMEDTSLRQRSPVHPERTCHDSRVKTRPVIWKPRYATRRMRENAWAKGEIQRERKVRATPHRRSWLARLLRR